MKLNEKIYQCRRSLGLSQEELAQRIGVTRQAVSKWELGTSVPELQAVVKLAREFGVTTDYLLVEEEDRQESQQSREPEPTQPDWTEKLPRFLKRSLQRHGWLGGLYICLRAVPFLLAAIWAQFLSSKISGATAAIHNATNPFAVIRTILLGIAALLILIGLLLAILLRHWGKHTDP